MGFPIEIETKIEELEAQSRTGPLEIRLVALQFGRWSRWIAVAGGAGYIPIAPGTAGSFVGVLLFLLAGRAGSALSLPNTEFLLFYGIAVVALLMVGIRAAGRAEIDFGRRDDGRIVIDEVVGQLIALAPVAPFVMLCFLGDSLGDGGADVRTYVDGVGEGNAHQNLSVFILEVVTGFVLFRLFDVWKPGAIRWAERRFGGGLGVMADDVLAGLYAALCLFALHALVFERLLIGPGVLG